MAIAARAVIRPIVVTAAAVALLLGGSIGTSADTGVWHSGRNGVHILADTAEYPAVSCVYGTNSAISAIRVRGPFVYARNSTSGRDTQGVAWSFEIQTRPAGTGTWTLLGASTLQKAVATDTTVAPFTSITKAFRGTAANEYRVVVVMRWYDGMTTTIVGRAGHRADWYSWEGVPSFAGLCPGGIF